MEFPQNYPTYEQCEGAFLGAKSPSEGIEAIRRICLLASNFQNTDEDQNHPHLRDLGGLTEHL